jgi:hypothetical protein
LQAHAQPTGASPLFFAFSFRTFTKTTPVFSASLQGPPYAAFDRAPISQQAFEDFPCLTTRRDKKQAGAEEWNIGMMEDKETKGLFVFLLARRTVKW